MFERSLNKEYFEKEVAAYEINCHFPEILPDKARKYFDDVTENVP